MAKHVQNRNRIKDKKILIREKLDKKNQNQVQKKVDNTEEVVQDNGVGEVDEAIKEEDDNRVSKVDHGVVNQEADEVSTNLDRNNINERQPTNQNLVSFYILYNFTVLCFVNGFTDNILAIKDQRQR